LQFSTKIPIQKCNFPIDYDSKILLLGSCFAENIGKKFDYFKFQSTTNPFGIIFNAVSLEKLIRRAVENRTFTENDIFYHNELWHCYEVHSELSHPYKEEFLNNLNLILETTKNQINSLSHCIITLGTSWVYRNIESNEIVANCHKVPQKHFRKELLSINQTEESLQNIVSLVHSVNPNCHFIFTVSPVRHIKDGFVENSLSKAHLVSSIFHALQVPPMGAEGAYFPSYEIMMDELRDYRFYAEDMLHPNQTAIDYIWEQFVTSTISEECKSLMIEIENVQKSLAHKPFNPNSESHQKFIKNLDLKIKAIQNQYPFIKFC
jgi:hypothetical protein